MNYNLLLDLMIADVKVILIMSTPEDPPKFKALLGIMKNSGLICP